MDVEPYGSDQPEGKKCGRLKRLFLRATHCNKEIIRKRSGLLELASE